jgi:hypothetical protein
VTVVPTLPVETTLPLPMNHPGCADFTGPTAETPPDIPAVTDTLESIASLVRRSLAALLVASSLFGLASGQDAAAPGAPAAAAAERAAAAGDAAAAAAKAPAAGVPGGSRGAADPQPRSLVIDDEPATTSVLRLGEPEAVVPPRLVEEVAVGPGEGMFIQEYGVGEIPRDDSSGTWFSSGMRYGSAEFLMLDRARNYRRNIAFDPLVTPVPNRNNGAGTFTTQGIPFNLAPAARITVGEYLGRDDLDRDRSVEFTYYGGMSFFLDDTYNASPGSFLLTPLAGPFYFPPIYGPGLPGFTGATTMQMTNSTVFNSMEINYKMHRRLGRDQLVMSPNGGWARHAERGWLPSIFVGTRVANLNEGFTLTSWRTDQPTDVFSGDYVIATQNWLWGLNLGAELISQNEYFYWGLRGRAAPAVNFVGGQQYGAGVNNIPTGEPPASGKRGTYILPRQAASQVGAAFIGDLSCIAGINLTPNFQVQLGYELLWVAGVATATRQFNLDNVRPNSLDPGGQVFLMGFSGGIQGSW